MKKRLVALFLAVIFCLSLITGCGGGDTPAADAPASDAPTAPEASSEQDPATLTEKDYWRQCEGEEIIFATYVGGEADYVDSLLSEFYDLTGINVTIEQYPEDQLYQKVQIDTVSGTGSIDCFTMDMMRMPEFASSGYLTKVQGYIDNPQFTDKEWYQPDDILAGPLSTAKYNGELYGIPYTGETNILMYRKDLLEAAGCQVPTNFDELWDVASKIHSKETAGIALRGQRGSGMNIYTWTQFFRGFGGEFFVDFPNDMTPTVNTPEAIEATKYYAEILQNYGPQGVANWTNMEVYTGQASGKVAMTMDANAFAAIIEDENTSKTRGLWGCAMVPGGKGGSWPAIYSHTMCINEFSQSKDAAWLFVQWVTSPEMTLKRGLKTGVPARASSWEAPEMKEQLSYICDGTYTDVCLESLQKADASYRPIFPNWNEMGDILGIAVQDVIAGGSTAEAALNKAQADIETMLKQKGYLS